MLVALLSYVGVLVVWVVLLLCLYPRLKQKWEMPFGANYVVLVLLYFYAIFGYMDFVTGFDWESWWVCLTLLFSCLFLPALFWGLKSQHFGAAYIFIFLALFSVTAWFYAPHAEGSLSFMVALPVGVAFLLFYFLGNIVSTSSDQVTPAPDYLNRKEIYRSLTEEIRCMANRCLNGEKNAQGVNVALCSPWGSGKSHFLSHLCNLASHGDPESKGWQNSFIVKRIDIWKASEEKELWESVNEALIYAVLEDKKARLFYAEKTFVHSLLSVTVYGGVAQDIYDLIYHKGDNYSVRRINECIEKKRVLLIFEDLERAKPHMLMALLSLIDRLRKISNLVSVCSVDMVELERLLGGGGPDRPQSYISKVFDRCLYLPAPEPHDMDEMSRSLCKGRFRSSILIPELFKQFRHSFETPRKLIRVFEALESLENLHLWRLTRLRGFSFASLPEKTSFLPILVICEVEIIRACEPDLLESLILNGGLSSFFKMCPAEIADQLKEEEYDYVNFLDSLPANITFFRKAKPYFFNIYPVMQKVIMDNGCVLEALAHLYSFRKHAELENYFVYAVTRGYERDGNSISRLCELLQVSQGEPADTERLISPVSAPLTPHSGSGHVEPQETLPPVPDSLKNEAFADFFKDKEAINYLKQRNQNYPVKIDYYSNCNTSDFVRLLICGTDTDVMGVKAAEENFTKLTHLYQSMRLSQQAYVLTTAFYLSGSRDKDDDTLDSKYQHWLKESVAHHQQLSTLCEIFAQKLFCIAVNRKVFEREKEHIAYDHHFHPYKRLQDTEQLQSFQSGFRQIFENSSFAPADMLVAFIVFLGTSYRSGDRYASFSSSFATPKMVNMMEFLYKLIQSAVIAHPLTDEQKSAAISAHKETLAFLNADKAQWQQVPYSSHRVEEYNNGMEKLISLLNCISQLWQN